VLLVGLFLFFSLLPFTLYHVVRLVSELLDHYHIEDEREEMMMVDGGRDGEIEEGEGEGGFIEVSTMRRGMVVEEDENDDEILEEEEEEILMGEDEEEAELIRRRK